MIKDVKPSRPSRPEPTGRTYAEFLVRKFSEEAKKQIDRENAEKIKEPEGGEFVKWLNELSKKELAVAGGKGANLAEMYNMNLPVPRAFVVTAQAYAYFIKSTRIDEKIYAILNRIDVNNTAELEDSAKEIQKVIISAQMPVKIQDEVIESYDTLNLDSEMLKREDISMDALNILRISKEPEFVAVRSSATTEDLGTASFAGQQETFVNVKGNAELLESVKKCWASLFTARAIYYRQKRGFKHVKAEIAVIVQRMVNSDKSGVIFTINPLNNKNEIVIEAVFGLGEGIVSGAIEPDQYLMSKPDLRLTSKHISRKEIFITRTADGKTVKMQLPEIKKNQQVLTESEMKQLANYSLRLEEHYNHPQDIEFGVEAGRCYILQTRPVTTKAKVEEARDIKATLLSQGLAASPGIASGKVKIVYNLIDLEKVMKGDVLVTKMTNPDMVVTMQRAAAIVTDEGGSTAHAAIVSREMGIPCVVGTKNATQKLKDGMEITVDGTSGKVYEGRVEGVTYERVKVNPIVKTRTKIKVITDLPEYAERAAEAKVDGIGLLRLEGIIAGAKKHPMQYLKENRVHEYEELIFNGVKRIVEHFTGHECWVRTSDIRTDEFNDLPGAPRIERNPMLGMHGIRASLKYPGLFKAELRALKRVADLNIAKIGVMMPQVISVEEIQETKKLMQELDMHNVVLGIMVETPAAVELMDKMCEQKIHFASMGTNDLTQFTLAIDRGNEQLQALYNEMNPAVLRMASHVINVCKKYGVKSSICGQAGSNPEMARFLVQRGIDSISVNADAAHEISKIVQEEETKLEDEKKREHATVQERLKEFKEKVEKSEEEKEHKKEEKEKELEEIEQHKKPSDIPSFITEEEQINKELGVKEGGEEWEEAEEQLDIF
ncbi:phosphoenolpyruvate synthase [Candidatus Pacearchaeota archaeon]|nr:phosphoenolpyruvate synthase [Candidatus Pacearchaeota archaeon]